MRVIAIDGPSGSGKSTIARRLAEELGLEHLDTGAMYRAVTFGALHRGIEPTDKDGVVKMMKDLFITLEDGRVVVDGVDATVEIRGPQVTRAVSDVASIPEVRQDLVALQRDWVRLRDGGVVEGRDIATVVFPDATLKVFLTARADVRAGRRHNETNHDNYDETAGDMKRRDEKDATRAVDPLRAAPDAAVIDTSDMSVDDIVAELLGMLQ